jgi:HEAT repeat protein
MSLRAVLLAALLVLLAARAARADEVADQVRALGQTDGQARVNALNALRTAQDPRAVALILQQIDGFDALGRYYAVMVLDAYPPKDVQPAFRQLARSKDPYLRLAAGTALHQQGDRKALDIVLEALADPAADPAARTWMFVRLYGLRDPRVDAAVRTLVRAGAPLDDLSGALYVLHLHEDRGAREVVAKVLEDERPEARALAAAWLYRFGDAARARELAALLGAGDLDVNHFFRIESFLAAAGRLDEEILAALAAGLETEKNVSVLARKIALLQQFGFARAVPQLQKLLRHESTIVAKAAFTALGALGGGEDAESLRALLAADDLDRRLWAADALRRADDASGFEVVLGVLQAGTPLQRREAAELLGRFRRAAAVPPLLDALLDAEQTVRSAAQFALPGLLAALFPYRRFDLATSGYAYDGNETARREAVARIRAWWDGHRDGDW